MSEENKAPEQPLTGIQLYTGKGAVIALDEPTSNGGHINSMRIAKLKQVATAFGCDQATARIKQEECTSALKTVAVLKTGAFNQDPNIGCNSIVSRRNKSGKVVRHTIVYIENVGGSAKEQAAASYLGKSVAEVRAMRAKAQAEKPATDVASTVTPVAAPAEPVSAGV